MGEERPTRRLTLAEKLDRLFKTAHPRHRDEYTYEEVAQGVREQGGPTISPAYIWQLRKGVKDNPRKNHLEALAEFFNVPPSYFFDEEAATRIHAQLELLAAIRDAKIRTLALRASDLSPEAITAVSEMIEHLRLLQGLPDGEDGGEQSEGDRDHGTQRDE